MSFFFFFAARGFSIKQNKKTLVEWDYGSCCLGMRLNNQPSLSPELFKSYVVLIYLSAGSYHPSQTNETHVNMKKMM